MSDEWESRVWEGVEQGRLAILYRVEMGSQIR